MSSHNRNHHIVVLQVRSLSTPIVGSSPEYSDVGLDVFIAKQAAGGRMLNPIATVANSILGAAAYLFNLLLPLATTNVAPSFDS